MRLFDGPVEVSVACVGAAGSVGAAGRRPAPGIGGRGLSSGPSFGDTVTVVRERHRRAGADDDQDDQAGQQADGQPAPAESQRSSCLSVFSPAECRDGPPKDA